jgi:hypothetical protein
MTRVSARSAIAVLGLISASVTAIGHDDGQGRDWRPLTQTVGIGWTQAAAVCPQDGLTPCSGTVSGRSLSDWVWATREQTLALLGQFTPDILTSPNTSLFGFQYTAPAANFFAAFGIIQRIQTPGGYFSTGTDFTGSSGSTATYDPSGSPVGAKVFISDGIGGFLVSPISLAESGGGGLFLWRATGKDDGSVHAYDDEGKSPAPAGGIATNVLNNDWAGGVRATTALVSISSVTAASHPGVTLDESDGSVDVAAGTPIGTYSLVYRICDVTNASNCDDATVTVTVPSFAIVAVNDQGYGAFGLGGTAVANVLANDTLGGLPATTSVVSISQVSSTHAGITLNPAVGSVNVAAGTTSGIHSLVYQICEISNPAKCAQATVTIRPSVIDAVNDYVRAPSKTAAVIIPSVLNNDTFNGGRATTDKVKLSQVSLTPYGTGISLNLSTGAVSTTAKTSSGDYSLVYQICEIGNLANCDQATATLEISGRSR